LVVLLCYFYKNDKKSSNYKGGLALSQNSLWLTLLPRSSICKALQRGAQHPHHGEAGMLITHLVLGEERFPGLSAASWAQTQLTLGSGRPGEDSGGL